MSALSKRVLGLVIVLTMACGGNPRAPAGPDPSPTATLRGVVHVIPTGPPIAGVTVTVQNRTTMTAADGMFGISDLATGETAVTLRKEGYAPGDIRLTLVAGDNVFSLGMAISETRQESLQTFANRAGDDDRGSEPWMGPARRLDGTER